MDRKAIVTKLQKASDEGNRILEQMVQLRDEKSDRFGDAVCDFIRCRYMLDRVPGREENIYALAEESVDHMVSSGFDKRTAMETEGGCTGATTGIMKKVLLILTIKKALDLKATEEEFTAVDTVEQLICLCQG